GSSMSSRTQQRTRERVRRSLRRRYRAERRFRLYGLSAVLVGVVAVAVLFGTILGRGVPAFRQAEITLDIHYDAAAIDPAGTRDPATLAAANYAALVRAALRERFPDVEGGARTRALYELVGGA